MRNLRFVICDLRLVGALTLVALALIGCISGSGISNENTVPATISDPAATQPSYWYQQPTAASAVYDSFSTLFKTCENVSRDFYFKIDRVDYRDGILTTVPLESAQAFEPWRPDVQTFQDARESTLASIRRTIRWEFKRQDDGTFEVTPKVLVERQTVQERRITNVALYRGAYTKEKPSDAPQGSHEADEGFLIPGKYWYSVGRDPVLESKLALEV